MNRLRQIIAIVFKGQYRQALAVLAAIFAASVLSLGAGAWFPTVAPLLERVQLALLAAALFIVGLLLVRLAGKLNDTKDLVSLVSILSANNYRPIDFFTDGAAATPTLALIVLKILQLCRPVSILELGSGQTTKLLSSYIQRRPDVRGVTLEESQEWHAHLSRYLNDTEGRHRYKWSPINALTFSAPAIGERVVTHWFSDVDALRTERFDFILVDGPDGPAPAARHARAGLLNLLPEILATSFVIVFDDAERYGESTTTDLCEKILQASGRKFVRFEVHGGKTQVVMCSLDFHFLRSV